MLFNSLEYLLFLPAAAFLYYAAPQKLKRYILLAASLFFYGSLHVNYLFLLLFTIAATYAAGLGLERANASPIRKLIVFAAFAANLGLLAYFKYMGLLIDGVNAVIGAFGGGGGFNALQILLPAGISFYTLQSLGYVMDVYRKKIPAERNLPLYALFVSFFPQLLAGPIGRAADLLAQMKTPARLTYDNLRGGFLLMLWGYFKKLVIADRLAVFVNHVHADAGAYRGVVHILTAVVFLIQLYADFSGYSHIAIGSAKLFGITLMKNFDTPFNAVSSGEFWRRWHISLSSWFRDYLYFPLGGGKKGRFRKAVNQIIVFLVSGLWHGAGLNYIVWGFLNGLYLVCGELLAPARGFVRQKLGIDPQSSGHKTFQTALTFALAVVAFVFFRAAGLAEAVQIIQSMIYPNLWVLTDGTLLTLGLSLAEMLVALSAVLCMLLAERGNRHIAYLQSLRCQHILYRWAVYLGAVLVVLIFGVYGTNAAPANFLYFQF